MPKLADRLKYIRQMKDLSQVELAELAGATQQAIQQAETGKARQPRYLHRIARKLDIPIEWMIVGEASDGSFSSSYQKNENGFYDKKSEVLDSFYNMSEEDQELIFKLMKSRNK